MIEESGLRSMRSPEEDAVHHRRWASMSPEEREAEHARLRHEQARESAKKAAATRARNRAEGKYRKPPKP